MERTSVDDPRFVAAIKLLERTGMHEFQMRYSDDEQPIVWLAVATYYVGRDGRPRPKRGVGVDEGHVVGAAFGPLAALLRLLDEVVDGGECAHCHKPTGVITDATQTAALDELICWWRYDPELAVFRRSCDGAR